MPESMIQSLESRRLLSSTVSFNGTEMTVAGNAADDTITVRETGGNVHVEWFDASGAFQTADINGITAIKITGGGGSDTINYTGDSIGADIHGDGSNAAPISSTSATVSASALANGLHLGNGQQKNRGNHGGSNGKGHGHNGKGGSHGGSHGGSDGNGGGGGGNNGGFADFITVSDDGSGSSVVHGDAGNDNITLLHGNGTQIFGDDGNDLIFVNTAAQGGSANVDAGAGDDTITTYDGINNINGGNGTDTLIDVGGLATNTVTNVEVTQSI